MSAPAESLKPLNPSRAWIAVCLAICAVILAFGVFGDRSTSGELAYELGYNLPMAFFLAGILHFAFRRRESTRTSWIGFALIYASLVVGSIIASSRQRSNLSAVASELEKTVAAVQSSLDSGSSLPLPMQLGSASGGETGKMELVLKQMFNRMLVQRREYELELDAIGWATILDGQRLRNDTTFEESRTMLKQAQSVVSKYRVRTDSLFKQLRGDIETAELKPETQRAMLTGFDKSTVEGKIQTLEMWTLEEQVIAQIEKALNLVNAKRGAWQIQKGKLMFDRQADLDLYNTYMSQVQKILAEQEKIQKKSLQRTQDTLKELSK